MDKKKTREGWALEAARFFYITMMVMALFLFLKLIVRAIIWSIWGCSRDACGVDVLTDGVIYSFRQIAIFGALWFTANLVKFHVYKRFNALGWNEGEKLKSEMVDAAVMTTLCLTALGVIIWVIL